MGKLFLNLINKFIVLVLLKMTNVNFSWINIIFNINPNKINKYLTKNT